MSCQKIKKLLYFAESELTDAERQRVRRHLDQCSDCRMEFENARESLPDMLALQSPPVLRNAQTLTDGIMRAVRNPAKKPTANFSIFKKPADALTQRKVQFVMGAAILLFLCLFGVQEAMILRRLYRLEERVAQQNSIAVETRSPLAALRRKAQLYDAAADGGTVIIDKKSLAKLLQSYSDLQVRNDLLLKILQEKGLTAAGIFLDDGLTVDEVQRLLADHSLLKKLYNL